MEDNVYDLSYDDVPTLEEPPDGYFDDGDSWEGPPTDWDGHEDQMPNDETTTAISLHDLVIARLQEVLAAQHGRTFSELGAMVRELKASTQVLSELDARSADCYDGIFEALLDLSLSSEGGAVDLRHVPGAAIYSEDVRVELTTIATMAELPRDGAHPHQVWFALKELVQRRQTRQRASRLIEAIDTSSTVEKLMERYRALQPPTTKRSITRTHQARTARQVISEVKSAQAGRPKIRFSSGLRTLDIAFTVKDEPLGFIAPGEGSVMAGPTGTGKTSMTYSLVPSLAQDIVNWGYKNGLLIWAHTEEESLDKIRGARLGEGQPFHHLADNVIVADIGSSRRALAETVYDTVVDARRRALDTGRPIDQFLPHVLVLDYIQSLSERGEDERTATATTAEYLLRGVQAWNPEEMAKFSGVRFEEYAGMPWPDGMEHHRVAGIYMAQLIKQDDKSLLYRPGARDCQLADFTLEDDRPQAAWTDPTGQKWCWEVREGDLRLFKQNAIRGSGVLLQNATTIVILHRSRPYNNPAATDENGHPHLADTRGRLILDKTRTGTQLKYVPTRFDVQENGHRAQYFDYLAEDAIADGRFVPHESWARSGDPILPRRPATSPLAGFRY